MTQRQYQKCALLKWNESGFRPPLCTYRLNWARGTSWGWWDEWDDTVLQTQDSKFEPWRSEAEHATSRSRRLPTILSCALLTPQSHIHDAQPTPWVTKIRAVRRCASMNFVRIWEEPASLRRIYSVSKINQVYKSANTQRFATAFRV